MTTTDKLYTRNILAVYYSASLADIVAGQSWYERANGVATMLSQTYGISLGQAAGVLAAVSPQMEWNANVRLAERLIHGVTRLGVTALSLGKYLTLGLRKVDLILADKAIFQYQIADILNGNKVKAFFFNITGNLGFVCVDGHAQNIANNGMLRLGISQAKSIRTKQYLILAEAYRQAADIAEIEPAHMQAITWIVYKNLDFIKGTR